MSWGRSEAARLLQRFGFGASATLLDAAVEQDRATCVEQLFARREHDPHLLGGIESLLALDDIGQLQAWWMALLLDDRAPLTERVSLMWHNHFATSWDKVGDVRLMHRQNQLLRELGLGDFRVLLHAIAKDPAMLVWLDGDSNRKGAPNENFAREVMELFALGIGNYSERDVQEAARGLSGWGVDGRRFVERSEHHDAGSKTLFGQTGRFGGRETIDLILAQPACALHVARRLVTTFVNARPSEDVVAACARTLVEHDWNIERTLRAMALSSEFDVAYEPRIVGPVELIVRTKVALSARITPASGAQAAARAGQALFRPPNVKGWEGGRTWVHAGSWLARHNFLSELALEHAGSAAFDPDACFVARERDAVAAEILRTLLPGARAGEQLEQVVRAATNEASDWNAALRDGVALVLTHPEYHVI